MAFDAITSSGLSLSTVENPYFLAFIRSLRPDAALPTVTRMREMAREARNASGGEETGELEGEDLPADDRV